MSKSIILDAGHGGSDNGATGFGIREKDWNLKITLYQYKRLKELGVNVSLTRDKDITLDSNKRTDLIRNKYDLCISNHFNAFNGSARGIEVIHSIFGGGAFAKNVAGQLKKDTDLPLRRVFTKKNSQGTDWYFMNRLTGNTTTLIIEYGFLDNKTDHNWYKQNTNFFKGAEAVIKAICKEVGVPYKPVKQETGKFYRVQTNSFSEKENAEKEVKQLEELGYKPIIKYE